MKIINFILLYSLIFILSGCAGKDEVVIEDTPSMIIPENKTTEIKYIHNDPFYPMKDKIEDLEFKIDQLRAQVLEYESSLHAPSLNADLLKLIKVPQIEHEILIENGTLIQGKIIQENSDNLIVQTRIGQLKLDKSHIKSINKVEPLAPNIIFNESTVEEKLSKENKSFSGTIINEGNRRGDFVRVLYRLWEPDGTLPAIIDSVFISGSSIMYNSGVISDACLNPGDIGTYSLSIDVPDSLNISHWTKEIKSDIFE